MKTIVGMLLFFSLCGLGNAQSQSENEKFSNRLNEQYDAISKIQGNVLQMLQEMILEQDRSDGDRIFDTTVHLEANVDALLTLSYIYSDMLNNVDKMMVKKFFNSKCRYTAKDAQMAIDIINKRLSSIQSIALVNEITKMRDAISNMLQNLEICKK